MTTGTALIAEFVCAVLCTDCPATEAWYKADSRMDMATLRAEAHWAKASEEQRDAIAAALGISEPFPNDKQWAETPKAIRADYEAAFNRAAERLAI